MWLRESIGTTYAKATERSDDNLLGVDVSRWGGLRPDARRRASPWAQRERQMADLPTYVKLKLSQYCNWHRWQP